MIRPIALCLERVGRENETRYVRCTARPGREGGLSIAADGSILWASPHPAICELWVAGDQRLMAVRPSGAPRIFVRRGERRLEMPEGRAVIILDEDDLEFGHDHFCVHVHGPTDEIHPPRPLRVGHGVAVATALALSVGCGDGESPVSAILSSLPPTSHVGSGGSGGRSPSTRSDAGTPIPIPIELGTGGRGARRYAPLAGTAGTAGTAEEIEIVDFPPL